MKDQGYATGDKDDTGKVLNRFRPDARISRQELATMVYRFAKARGAYTGSMVLESIERFKDADKILPYAREGLAWCDERGIMRGGQGPTDGYLMPQADATRAQAAKILVRVSQEIK